MIPINTLLRDHEAGHSDLQMTSFIIGREGLTDYGKFKQALRELDARDRNLRQLERDRARLVLKLEALRGRWLMPWHNRRLHDIDLQEHVDRLADADRAIEDCRRELEFFHREADALKRHIGNLTDERRAELDREFWLTKLRSQAAIEIVCNGGCSTNLVELILSLPPGDRVRLVGEIQQRDNLITSVMQRGLPNAG